MITLKAPDECYKIINDYMNLNLGNKTVRCPYYINKKNIKLGLRVLVGKGRPDEIVQEAKIYEKLKNICFDKMNENEIRDFLIKRHIGIDCSGYVVHILDNWIYSKQKKHLWNFIKNDKNGIIRKILYFLRPAENIKSTTLTGDLNSVKISNLNNVRPGDLIRAKGLKGGFHVMLIIEVYKDNGVVKKIKYTHSSRWFNNEHGPRFGEIFVKDPKKPLSCQKWSESYTFDEILKDKEYSCVRRLKFVNLENAAN